MRRWWPSTGRAPRSGPPAAERGAAGRSAEGALQVGLQAAHQRGALGLGLGQLGLDVPDDVGQHTEVLALLPQVQVREGAEAVGPLVPHGRSSVGGESRTPDGPVLWRALTFLRRYDSSARHLGPGASSRAADG